MAGRFEATAFIERPIEEVFAFLADGENDPKFSPRVLEIAKREGSGTRVTLYNVLEGHGPGKLITPLALRSARRGADDVGKAIKAAVEAA
jgi:hypothetical protein